MKLDIQSYILTCERHNKHLTWALGKMANTIPLTGAHFNSLSEESLAILEMFASRFTKLQDALGNKVLPAILELTQEPGEYPSFIDKLQRLEKIGAIPCSADWQQFRKIRNQFVHDYPDDADLNAANVNAAYEQAIKLQQVFEHIKKFIAKRIQN
jgi:hypothetical protein